MSREELDPLYRDAHLFVLPSINEGFGIVLIEAMSHGLPIVATRTGGIPEVVRDDVNAILSEPADSASLRTGIERLLTDPVLYRSMSEHNITRSKDFHDWDGFEDELQRTFAARIEAVLNR